MTKKITYQLDDFSRVGTSLRGHVIASYATMIEVFGEPNMPFSDKIWNEWAVRFNVSDEDELDSEEVYVTIYDWKESHPNQSRYGEYRWNVGSKSRKAVGLVLDALNAPETMERLDA